MDEASENTRSSMLHAWQFPQAIPETDVRKLADGNLVCIHDATLRRTATSNSPFLDTPVSLLNLAQVQSVVLEREEKVPLLEDILALMKAEKERKLYLEIKEAPFEEVYEMLVHYGVLDRILFVHESQDYCRMIKEQLPEAITMTWCSGTFENIVEHFSSLEDTHFKGVSQVQIHYPGTIENGVLHSPLPSDFLETALTQTAAYQSELQVCPLSPSPALLRHLYEKGVRNFVSNAPHQFVNQMKCALGS